MTDDDRKPFAQAYSRLVEALRDNKAPDAVTLRVYFDELLDLEIELVVAAAERFARTAQWFPKTSEWRAMVRQIEAERHAAQREALRKRPTALCDRCGDTGWMLLGPGETADRHIAPQRAQPCSCREQRRLELLNPAPEMLDETPRAATNKATLTRAESAAIVNQFARARPRLLKVMPNVQVEHGADE